MKKIHALLFMIIGIVVGVLVYQTFFEPKLNDNFDAITRSYNESNQYRNHLQDIWAERLIKSADSLVEKGHIEFRNASDSIRLVRKMTESMVQYIEVIDAELCHLPNLISPKTGRIKNLNESKLNYFYFMGDNPTSNGGRGDGKAKILYDSLKKYELQVEKLAHFHIPDSLRDSNRFYDKSKKPSAEAVDFAGNIIVNELMLSKIVGDIYTFEERVFFSNAIRFGLKKSSYISGCEGVNQQRNPPRPCDHYFYILSECAYRFFKHK